MCDLLGAVKRRAKQKDLSTAGIHCPPDIVAICDGQGCPLLDILAPSPIGDTGRINRLVLILERHNQIGGNRD